jgi:hypothetical protein
LKYVIARGKEKIIAGLAKENRRRVILNHSDSDLSHNFRAPQRGVI